jgi:hypothetical protein
MAMSRTRRRLLLWLVVLVLACVGALALHASLPRIVLWAGPRLAEAAGVEPLSFQVAELRWGVLALEDVRIGEADEVKAAGVRFLYGTAGLRRGRLDRIAIESLQVHARLGDDGLSIAPLDPLLRAEPAQTPPSASRILPVRDLRVNGVRIDLDAEPGAVTAQLEGEIALSVAGPGVTLRAPLRAQVESPALEFLAAGDLLVRGFVDLSGASPSYDVRTEVEGLDFALADLVGEDVTGSLHVVGPPPATPDAQHFELERLASGAELRDGLVTFSLEPDGALDLRDARFSVFGGTLRLDGRYVPGADTQRFRVRLQRVGVASLLEEADVAGLSGDGQADGSFYVELSEAGVRIEEGEVASKPGGGWIRYRPPGQGPLDYAAPQGLDLVRTALDNFRYRSLGGTLAGDAGGELLFALRIEGANPELYDGHPIKLDLNLRGPFLGLMRSSRTVTGIPESLEKRLSEGASR